MQLRTMIPAFILSNGKKEKEVRATKKERAGKTEVKQGREKTKKKGDTSERTHFNRRRQTEQVARAMKKTLTPQVSNLIQW